MARPDGRDTSGIQPTNDLPSEWQQIDGQWVYRPPDTDTDLLGLKKPIQDSTGVDGSHTPSSFDFIHPISDTLTLPTRFEQSLPVSDTDQNTSDDFALPQGVLERPVSEPPRDLESFGITPEPSGLAPPTSAINADALTDADTPADVDDAPSGLQGLDDPSLF